MTPTNEQVTTTTRGVTPGHGPRPIDTDLSGVLLEEYGIVDRGAMQSKLMETKANVGGAMETRRDGGGAEERGGVVGVKGYWWPRAWCNPGDRAWGGWEVDF